MVVYFLIHSFVFYNIWSAFFCNLRISLWDLHRFISIYFLWARFCGFFIWLFWHFNKSLFLNIWFVMFVPIFSHFGSYSIPIQLITISKSVLQEYFPTILLETSFVQLYDSLVQETMYNRSFHSILIILPFGFSTSSTVYFTKDSLKSPILHSPFRLSRNKLSFLRTFSK